MVFMFYNAYTQGYLGGGLKYNTNTINNTVGLFLKGGTILTEKFDINVDAGYYFSKQLTWSFDGDIQYHLVTFGDVFDVSPLAGINFSRFDKTFNSLLVGVSFTIGSENRKLYIEPRYILNFKQTVISAGMINMF
jgi:hypothetical protein